MKLNEGTEWMAHACVLLAGLPPDMALPRRALSEFFDLPEQYLAKHMQKLSRAGLVDTRRGPGGGYRLSRPADQINLLQIVEATEGTGPIFHCTEIRRRGPTRIDGADFPRPCGIARAMHAAEDAWRKVLGTVTVQQLLETGLAETPPARTQAAISWLATFLKEPEK